MTGSTASIVFYFQNLSHIVLFPKPVTFMHSLKIFSYSGIKASTSVSDILLWYQTFYFGTGAVYFIIYQVFNLNKISLFTTFIY